VPSLAILVSTVFCFTVLIDRQTDRQTESHTDADDRYTQATTVGVSSDNDGLVTTRTCCNKPCFFASTSSVHYAGRTRGAEIK